MKKAARKTTALPKTPRKTPSKPLPAKLSDFDRRWRPWAIGAGGIAAIATALWGVQATFVHLRLSEAEAQLKKNFAALASESLEPVRYELTSTLRGCQALVSAYYGSHRPERLEWAAQACITAGIETPDIYVGLAAARELAGQDADALKILDQISKKFEKSPDPLYRIAQIYRRNKKTSEAAEVLLKAAELAPSNNQLSMETLEMLSQEQRWSDARKIADRIKSVESDNPEVKLIIARALNHGGDTAGSQALVTQARALLDKRPELRSGIERGFPDLMQAAAGAPPATEPSRAIASPPQGPKGPAAMPRTF